MEATASTTTTTSGARSNRRQIIVKKASFIQNIIFKMAHIFAVMLCAYVIYMALPGTCKTISILYLDKPFIIACFF